MVTPELTFYQFGLKKEYEFAIQLEIIFNYLRQLVRNNFLI